MSEVTEEFEKQSREETQSKISTIVPRELLPNGAYAPIAGIYDVGWKEWLNLPEADYVKGLRRIDDDIIKENKEWVLRLAPMIEKGELTLDQIKLWEAESFRTVDNFSIDIVRHAFDNLNNREVRDIILRHASEEVGHSELKADFLVYGCGLDREKDLWNREPQISTNGRLGQQNQEVNVLNKESPILAYAVIPFIERSLPMMNRMMGQGLRKHYGFEDAKLGFYDLHTYVDIYHERLGLYLLGKYAQGRKLQDAFRSAFESVRRNYIDAHRQAYYSLIKMK